MKWETLSLIATNFGMFLASIVICYKVFKQKLEEFTSGINISKKVSRQSEIDLEVLAKMEQVKEYMHADRVHVYEFHNGEHYANGRSALKVSCTYEVYRTGVRAVQTELLSVPISCIPKFIGKLLDEQMFHVDDIEEIAKIMPSSYDLKKSQEIEAFSDLVIKNKNNEPVGFIGIQWCDKKNVVKDDMELYRLAAFVENKILSNTNQK